MQYRWRLLRSYDHDEIECKHLILTFRPMHQWRYVYWSFWGESELRWLSIQTPYVTITVKKVLITTK